MFDVSWSELLLVIVVAVVAIGPKQIPDVLYGLGRLVRRLQYMRFAMSKQFEDFMEQNDLNTIRQFRDDLPRVVNPAHGFEEDEQAAEQKLAEKVKLQEEKKNG